MSVVLTRAGVGCGGHQESQIESVLPSESVRVSYLAFMAQI